MDYEVKNIKMDAEFKICPTCGYEDGFHSMFKKDGDITRWLFICPYRVHSIRFRVQGSRLSADYADCRRLQNNLNNISLEPIFAKASRRKASKVRGFIKNSVGTPLDGSGGTDGLPVY